MCEGIMSSTIARSAFLCIPGIQVELWAQEEGGLLQIISVMGMPLVRHFDWYDDGPTDWQLGDFRMWLPHCRQIPGFDWVTPSEIVDWWWKLRAAQELVAFAQRDVNYVR